MKYFHNMTTCTLRTLLVFSGLVWAFFPLHAQIPAAQGLTLRWQHLFQDDGVQPPNTSVYPEDYLIGNDGALHFLHNTGLLEGSIITTLDSSGLLVRQVSNRVDNLGFRFAGTALENLSPDGQIRMTGQILYSNNIQAVPPVGRLAFLDIDDVNSTVVLPENQQDWLRSVNDRGLPWSIRGTNDRYYLVEPRVTSDSQYVAWIRIADANTAAGIDTMDFLERPTRNGALLGSPFDPSRIRGLEKLSDDHYCFLYSQPGNYSDTSRVAILWVVFDGAGNILQSIDISKACGYSFFPKFICRNGKSYVYGQVAPALFAAPDSPHNALVILDAATGVLWQGTVNNSAGNAIPFCDLTLLPDAVHLLLVEEGLDQAGNTYFRFHQWSPAQTFTTLSGALVFDDNKSRLHGTSLLLDHHNNPVMMAQIDRYNTVPVNGQTPDDTYHAAICLDATELGLTTHTTTTLQPLRQTFITPNPGADYFLINGLLQDKMYTCTAYDQLGNQIESFRYQAGSAWHGAGKWSAGVYFIRVDDMPGNSHVLRWLKK